MNIAYIGRNMYLVRKRELGKTQEEFAEMIGVSTDTVSKIERGAVLPSIRSMTEIAAVTGKPIEYFLQDPEKRT